MEKRLTCDEVAKIYGVKPITIWHWIREKKLPAVKVGKMYVIRPSDIERFEEERLTV